MTTTAMTKRLTTSTATEQPPVVQRTWRVAGGRRARGPGLRPGAGTSRGRHQARPGAGPRRFLSRSLLAWDPHAGFGQLQNQAYGYLFPMGPFYLLGHVAGVPDWVVQRAWWALLLVVAYTGLLALADELGVGTPAPRGWSLPPPSH